MASNVESQNTLIHDYDGDVAKRYFKKILQRDFLNCFSSLEIKLSNGIKWTN